MIKHQDDHTHLRTFKLKIEVQKRGFAVQRRATRHWNRLGPYFRVMRPPKYAHTPGTKLQHFCDFCVPHVRAYLGTYDLFKITKYRHILSQNTDKRVGDQLTASDRKNIGDNLVGYDISPDMTRISLVNMYLHQFASPQIHEYDSLSSEDRWNEYFDVILANPPFFSPKGGITPHNRFGVKSSKAEVLFVVLSKRNHVVT